MPPLNSWSTSSQAEKFQRGFEEGREGALVVRQNMPQRSLYVRQAAQRHVLLVTFGGWDVPPRFVYTGRHADEASDHSGDACDGVPAMESVISSTRWSIFFSTRRCLSAKDQCNLKSMRRELPGSSTLMPKLRHRSRDSSTRRAGAPTSPLV